ncbi:MAG: multiple sugar transport system substrate-binding protein, partial [Thermomicrobiales bacterium]|nr:multiple sugar transport system substrate-binding protein [Thermomicrobiales bacterium]
MAHDLDPRQREMLAKFVQSRLDRRSFVKRAAGAAASPFAARAVAATAATAFTAFTPAAVNAAQARLQQTGDSAEAAVAAAQQFTGTTLNVVWEDGLQSQDPTIFSGPKWEELTGIKINTVSKPFTELFPSQVAEHIGATGAY